MVSFPVISVNVTVYNNDTNFVTHCSFDNLYGIRTNSILSLHNNGTFQIFFFIFQKLCRELFSNWNPPTLLYSAAYNTIIERPLLRIKYYTEILQTAAYHRKPVVIDRTEYFFRVKIKKKITEFNYLNSDSTVATAGRRSNSSWDYICN